nr:hypothetical protein [uncultured Campylobacter sp.]
MRKFDENLRLNAPTNGRDLRELNFIKVAAKWSLFQMPKKLNLARKTRCALNLSGSFAG